jgi:transposase
MVPWHPPSAWERIMKIKDVFQKAEHDRITWNEAAEILGVDPRTIRRWKHTIEEDGFQGLLDKRCARPSPKRASRVHRTRVLNLYKELYWQWNTKHFHEQLKKYQVPYGYTWTKRLLQEAGLVQKAQKRDKHRRRRPRKPLTGMMLHIDGSEHAWIPGLKGHQDLMVVMDDADNCCYYAKLVDEENTRESMLALQHVVKTKGLYCSVYSDRASHFFHTPHSGGKVDLGNLTQIGRAMHELGIEMIPGYSPEARGRGERLFGTWQGRLPNELKLHGIKTIPDANQYIQESFLPWYNKNLTVEPVQKGSAFTPCLRRDLDYVFCVKEQRTVNHDNTVQWKKLLLQIEPSKLRISFAKCRVVVCEHFDDTLSVLYGHHLIGRYDLEGQPLNLKKRTNHVLPKADILISY